MRFDYQTIEDIKQFVSTNKKIIIPFGSVEAHGKHLPIAADTIIIEHILSKLDSTLSMPVLYYTPVNFAREQDLEIYGTINFDQEIWIAFIENILSSLYKKEFREFIFLTWHDTNRFITCLEKIKDKKEYNIQIIRTWQLAVELCKKNNIYVPPMERHAAHIETSALLFLKPELVKKDKLVCGKYENTAEPKSLDGSGVYGDATQADMNIGKEVLELVVDEIKTRIAD